MLEKINDDLSSHWVKDEGTKELFLPSYNPLTVSPWAGADEVRSFVYARIGDPSYWSEYISPEDRNIMHAEKMAITNAARAKQELLASDWSDLPSVRNEAIEPHLTNGAEFDAYRAALRGIVVNKPSEVAAWPVCPDASWSAT